MYSIIQRWDCLETSKDKDIHDKKSGSEKLSVIFCICIPDEFDASHAIVKKLAAGIRNNINNERSAIIARVIKVIKCITVRS